MDGVHDLGGMDNFGAILREENEPVFHGDWEKTVFSTTVAMLGAGYFNIDELRRTTEKIPPAQYLSSSYYEKWLETLLSVLAEKGVVTAQEVQAAKSLRSDGVVLQALTKADVEYITSNPLPATQTLEQNPEFEVGDKVSARVMHPLHHTRLPRYVRGKHGYIAKNNGAFRLPDTNAHGGPATPQFNYSVCFASRELWGSDSPPNDSLFIDLYESYMEHA